MKVNEVLESLTMEQLNELEKKLYRLDQERKQKLKGPLGLAKVEDLAAANGLDLSSLQREIARMTK